MTSPSHALLLLGVVLAAGALASAPLQHNDFDALQVGYGGATTAVQGGGVGLTGLGELGASELDVGGTTGYTTGTTTTTGGVTGATGGYGAGGYGGGYGGGGYGGGDVAF